ncbi:MAG: type II toxin-antitoxin system VapB family antitoxin [Gallionella sp.]|nr:type II toxin-antitoxin system VapB family antitoxin [Gallionella sp.]
MKPDNTVLHLTVGEPADELLAKAQHVSGLKEKAALVQEGLRALIERESARHLARLAGTEPQLQPTTRRQSEPA